MEKIINLDVRLKNGPVGFCAVENGKLAGFVGVLDIPTKTTSGKEEMVGGIWCVATSSPFAKKGICKILMDKAHQYFKDKKYPFSFLQTIRTLIAYAIYEKMEYVEIEKVNRYPEAYKVFQKDKPEKKPESKLDPAKIREIYQEFAKDRTGFVIRQKDFVKMFSQRKRFEEKKSFQEENGYVLLFEDWNVTKIQELTSRDEVTLNKLLDQVEAAAQNGVIDRMITDERLLRIYKDRGYNIYEERDNNVFMVKKLVDMDFEKTYGEVFHIGELDLF
jgi:predicted acetyltransferase